MTIIPEKIRQFLLKLLGANLDYNTNNNINFPANENFNNIEMLSKSVNDLSTMAYSTVNASIQIANRASGVASGSTETQNYINDATSSVINISKNLEKAANEYIFVSSISQQLKIMTDESKLSINNTIEEIKIISQNTLKTKNSIYNLKEKTSHIKKVVEVITSIANSTSLLSLNATIESAKAGEYGKGFAVVASEVKKLAEQSHKSAKEISEMIKFILEDTELAVKDIDRTSELVSKSIDVINNSSTTFEMISVASEEVNNKIQDVTNLTKEVLKDGDAIASIIKSLHDINSKNLEELASIAQASQCQLDSLKKVATTVDNVEKISSEIRSSSELL